MDCFKCLFHSKERAFSLTDNKTGPENRKDTSEINLKGNSENSGKLIRKDMMTKPGYADKKSSSKISLTKNYHKMPQSHPKRFKQNEDLFCKGCQEKISRNHIQNSTQEASNLSTRNPDAEFQLPGVPMNLYEDSGISEEEPAQHYLGGGKRFEFPSGMNLSSQDNSKIIRKSSKIDWKSDKSETNDSLLLFEDSPIQDSVTLTSSMHSVQNQSTPKNDSFTTNDECNLTPSVQNGPKQDEQQMTKKKCIKKYPIKRIESRYKIQISKSIPKSESQTNEEKKYNITYRSAQAPARNKVKRPRSPDEIVIDAKYTMPAVINGRDVIIVRKPKAKLV